MGMFGNLFGKGQPAQIPAQPAPTGVNITPPSNKLFGDGSIGGIAGGIGKLLAFGPMVGLVQQEQGRRYRVIQAQQEAELQRQQQLQNYKAQHPEPTPMQRNYEYLKQTNPALAETYLRAEANPMTLMTDPLTGNLRFMPRGGDPSVAPMQGAPQQLITKTIGNKTYYSQNGSDWYDNPGMQ